MLKCHTSNRDRTQTECYDAQKHIDRSYQPEWKHVQSLVAVFASGGVVIRFKFLVNPHRTYKKHKESNYKIE